MKATQLSSTWVQGDCSDESSAHAPRNPRNGRYLCTILEGGVQSHDLVRRDIKRRGQVPGRSLSLPSFSLNNFQPLSTTTTIHSTVLLHCIPRSTIPKATSTSCPYLLPSTASTTAKMLPSATLYTGAACFATATGIGAAAVAAKLPIQHNKTGPFNYQRALKSERVRRVSESRVWRRLPKMV